MCDTEIEVVQSVATTACHYDRLLFFLCLDFFLLRFRLRPSVGDRSSLLLAAPAPSRLRSDLRRAASLPFSTRSGRPLLLLLSELRLESRSKRSLPPVECEDDEDEEDDEVLEPGFAEKISSRSLGAAVRATLCCAWSCSKHNTSQAVGRCIGLSAVHRCCNCTNKVCSACELQSSVTEPEHIHINL